MSIIKDYVEEGELLIDGCDNALIGVQGGKAVYAWHLLVLHFMNEFSKDGTCGCPCDCEKEAENALECGECECECDWYTQAVEWVDYNIMGAYMGEGTPIIIDLRAPFGGFTKDEVDEFYPMEYKGVNRLDDILAEVAKCSPCS